MSNKQIVMIFKPDGTAEIRGVEGEPVEKQLKWLLDSLGQVEKRGHKHAQSAEEGIKVHN